MRILFLTPQLPYPPHQGTAMRNYGLIRGLAERHQVSLLSFLESNQSLDAADPLLALCQGLETVPAPPPRRLVRRALDTFTRRLPDMGLRLASPAFANRLAAWLARESFDVVHVEGLEMSPYLDLLLFPPSSERTGPKSQTTVPGHGSGQILPLVVFDDHNCEYMLQKRYAQIDARMPQRWVGALYSLVQWQKLRPYEASVCRRAHRVLAVSQADAKALRQLVPDLDVMVIPNGLDTDLYQPAQRVDQSTDQPTDASCGGLYPLTLVFTGKMDFRPNVDAVRWFADAIWARVRAEVPEAHFYAVGQRPHPQLDRLRADPSLTLTGWVEDVRPYIARATVYVAPLRMGSGTRLKLLEAMAMGKAIVSTRMGAEGLTDLSESTSGQVADDRELVLVDDNDPAAFADAVVALLRDPARRARLGVAARAFVRAHYDWRVIIPRLETLYIRS
jgi:glycosyltransferase involved in cell wall biosynthesis